MRLKTGDKVVVIAGKDKGKEGTILSVLPKQHRVVVEGVNIVKKHQKPGQFSQGGIVEEEAAIHVSNVQLIDPSTGKGSRVHIEERDGKKVRVTKSGEALD